MLPNEKSSPPKLPWASIPKAWASFTSPTNTWVKVSSSSLKMVKEFCLNSEIPAMLPPTTWVTFWGLIKGSNINTASSGLVALRSIPKVLAVLSLTKYWPDATSPMWMSTAPLFFSTTWTRNSFDISWISVSRRSSNSLGCLSRLLTRFKDALTLASWSASWFSELTCPVKSL